MAAKKNNYNDELDKRYVARTLELAKKAEGFASPNPIVGAVVVKNGKIVGEGWHEKAGMPHAEVMALNKAGKEAEGATIYVSLEPCSHFGQTPPCVSKIKESGIRRVVAAVSDPNPLVAGKGFEYLMDAGIEVKYGILEKEAEKLNESFFKYISTGMPFITLKNALTLDGKIGYKKNKGVCYISSKESLKYTHHLRLLNDAIMVSANTVICDNPSLDVRLLNAGTKKKFLSKKYVKIVLDPDLSVPLNSKIFTTHGSVLIFTSPQYNEDKKEKLKLLREKGAVIQDVSYKEIKGKKFLNLPEVLKKCAEMKITSILVEPGQKLFASLISQNLFDKLIFNLTPDMIGEEKGLGLFDELSLGLKDKIKLTGLEIKKIRDEIFLTYYNGVSKIK